MRTELAEALSININTLDLVSLTLTPCTSVGCCLPAVLNNYKRCVLCAQTWFSRNFTNRAGERVKSRGHGLYGPQFMRLYKNCSSPPKSCCCGMPLCGKIGHSHEGMMCFLSDPGAQCNEAARVLGITSSVVRAAEENY